MSPIKKLEVVIACPGDVEGEKKLVKESIFNVNILAKHLNIEFVAKDWEYNTYPTVAKYAQDAINIQFGDDYEVLIGIFWSKIGTPTPKHRSGTVEEIERALERQKEDQSVNLMLYFKTTLQPTKRQDSNELEQLKHLIGDWGKRGVYFWKFNKKSDFGMLVTRHLMLLAEERYFVPNEISHEASGYFKNQVKVADEAIDTSLRFLDSLKDYSRYSSEKGSLMSKIADLIVKNVRKTISENDKINYLLEQPKSDKIGNKIKIILRKSGISKKKHAVQLTKELQKFRAIFIKEYDQYNNTVLIASQMGKTEKQMMREINKNLPEIISGNETFKKIIDDAIKTSEKTIAMLPNNSYSQAEQDVKKAYELFFDINQEYFRILRESYASSIKLLKKKWFQL
ncbi:MAG: hypothetical protein GQ574_28415 [Crocinitomix sp.]|nr:hypothetical protein [Crocinitomix sp.]